MAGDESFHGRLFPEVREEGVELGSEKGSTPHVLGPGVLAPFKDKDIQPRSGHEVGSGASRRTGPYYDGIKFVH